MNELSVVARIDAIRSRFQSFAPTGPGPAGRLGLRTPSASGPGGSPATASPDAGSSAFAEILSRTSGTAGIAGGDPALPPASRAALDWSTPSDSLPAQTPYAELFTAAAARHGLSPRLLAAVAQVESSFDPTAVSPAGAQGLMQLMPGTAQGLGADPWDPASAIDGAARLLAGHQQRFGSLDLALAAYNVGSGTVSRAGGQVPASARRYVDKVFHLTTGGLA